VNVLVLANMGRFMRFERGPFWPMGGLLVWFLWLVILGLIAFMLLTMLRRRDAAAKVAPPAGGPSGDPSPAAPMSPLDVAKMRYARGELTREEFEALKQDLE
jgi:putative membrane protein